MLRLRRQGKLWGWRESPHFYENKLISQAKQDMIRENKQRQEEVQNHGQIDEMVPKNGD